MTLIVILLTAILIFIIAGVYLLSIMYLRLKNYVESMTDMLAEAYKEEYGKEIFSDVYGEDGGKDNEDL